MNSWLASNWSGRVKRMKNGFRILKDNKIKMTFSEKARSLIREQIDEWDLPAKNYAGLQKTKIKRFEYENYSIQNSV